MFDAFGTRRKAFLVSKVIFVLNTLTPVIKHINALIRPGDHGFRQLTGGFSPKFARGVAATPHGVARVLKKPF